MRDLKLGKDFIVTVHNALVEARFTYSLAILSHPSLEKTTRETVLLLIKLKKSSLFVFQLKTSQSGWVYLTLITQRLKKL